MKNQIAINKFNVCVLDDVGVIRFKKKIVNGYLYENCFAKKYRLITNSLYRYAKVDIKYLVYV